MNSIKTGLLLGALTGLLMLIGGWFGGNNGVVIAFLFATVMNLGAYWFSDKIVLSMYKAQEVSVAVTEGILRILDREELEGVISHELSHIKHRDILIGSIAATIAGAISMLAHMAQWAAIFGGSRSDDDEGGGGNIIGLLAMAILAPIAATIIQMAISRSREYLADDGGARISRKPYALASALEKLSRASQVVPMEANPATAHMFIVNPLTGRSFMSLFSTHPPIEERIARLRSMRPV
ncbi:MAG: hypothetical protein A4E73_01791 [Syntrophaceae bacterium PtaU1.Bin231]|nr:MAG: hypothetical protein A4E73_01791 [Syntrophaceae bacterium PtaU1.Bin231]